MPYEKVIKTKTTDRFKKPDKVYNRQNKRQLILTYAKNDNKVKAEEDLAYSRSWKASRRSTKQIQNTGMNHSPRI